MKISKPKMGILEERQYVYADASFSKAYGLAVMGYVVFNCRVEHEQLDASQRPLNIHSIKEENNIRAEVRGVILALKACATGSNVVLFSDCQTVTGLVSRKEKLIASNFIGKKTNKPHKNADIYQAFYDEIERVNSEIRWIAGHTPKIKHSQWDRNFSYVDKEVRKKLRDMIRVNDNTL